jgi:hypothetical protein
MEIVALVFAAGAFMASCLAIIGLVLLNKTQQGFRQSLNVFFESQEKIAGEIAGLKQSDQGGMMAALMFLAPLTKQLLDARPLIAPLDDSRSRKADDIRRQAARSLEALGVDTSSYVGEDDDEAGDPDIRAVVADYLHSIGLLRTIKG